MIEVQSSDVKQRIIYQNFDAWFAELQRLADNDDNGWIVADKDSYFEYFEDGDSPRDTLLEQYSYCDND